MLATAVLALAAWATAHDVAAWNVLYEARLKTAALQAGLDRARAVTAARGASAAVPPTFAVDARRWMALSSFDSGGVLRSVESAQVAGAKLVSLEIDARDRRVQLEVEVTSADVATAYLQALNAGSDRPLWALTRLQAQAGIESALIVGQMP